MLEFLPWQVENAKRLLADPERLPHALLIHGSGGTGKREFALAVAAALLCEDRQEVGACGKCQGCVWLAAGTHPDFKQVRPEAVAAREGIALADDDLSESATGSGSTTKTQGCESAQFLALRTAFSW